jgi:phosphoglycolate phosphatase
MLGRRPVRHVIWDWNGTLLDDLEHSVAVMNELLADEGLAPLSVEGYQRVFDFPVRDYYERLGFDLSADRWERLASRFIQTYDRGVERCRLHAGARELLERLALERVRSSILTAARRHSVERLLDDHGARDLVTEVIGLDDHYAGGKRSIALAWQAASEMDPAAAVLVGDTVHDAEVARALGVRCILVTLGHHGADRLAATGYPVVGSFSALSSLFAPA